MACVEDDIREPEEFGKVIILVANFASFAESFKQKSGN